MDKIIKMISRNEQMERNGGGQWVATHRVHKSKKTYSRKRFKRDTKHALDDWDKLRIVKEKNVCGLPPSGSLGMEAPNNIKNQT